MSQNGNPTTKTGQDVQVPGTQLQLLISWDQLTGAIRVDGPAIQNKVAAYGMLELAKETISQWHEQQKKSGGIVLATPAPPSLRM